jgi:hypothetical protein
VSQGIRKKGMKGDGWLNSRQFRVIAGRPAPRSGARDSGGADGGERAEARPCPMPNTIIGSAMQEQRRSGPRRVSAAARIRPKRERGRGGAAAVKAAPRDEFAVAVRS